MASQEKGLVNAANCADQAGKHAFGLNDVKVVAALRQLADDIEKGIVAVHSLTTSSHATHDQFAVREVTIEILEEIPQSGPKIVRE